MSELAGTFTTNREDVAAKVIDGELIIIRLSDGTYYSMDNVGTSVWEMIEAHIDLRTLVREIAARYEAPAAEVESDVSTLIRELMDEGLIVPAEGAGGVPAVRPWNSRTSRATVTRLSSDETAAGCRDSHATCPSR